MSEVSEPQDFHSILNPEDVSLIAKLYDEIRDEWKRIDPQKDYELAADFDAVARFVNEGFAQMQTANFELKAKYEFLTVCQQKATELISYFSSDVGSVVLEVNRELNKILEELLEHNCAKARPASSLEELEAENAELKLELEALRLENKKYFDKIVRNSKNNASQALLAVPQAKSKFMTRVTTNSSLKPKDLALKQLKEVIEELCQSKAKHNQAQDAKAAPRETMEEHLYTFLHHKYQQKSVVIQWAASIITAVKKFASTDREVAVFNRILRNECEEEFRPLLLQTRATIRELFKMQIKAKDPLKSNKVIAQIVTQRVKGPLAEEEWRSIVSYMYSDSSRVLDAIKELLLEREQISPKDEVMYTDFVNAVLDTMISEHSKWLQPIINQFKEVDENKDGAIDRNQCQALLEFFEVEDAQEVVGQVDPLGTNKIIFSHLVESCQPLKALQFTSGSFIQDEVLPPEEIIDLAIEPPVELTE